VQLGEFAIMAVALGGGGLVKGATGMGLPLVALPILAAFLDVPQAIAIVCVTGIVTNAWQLWRFRADLRTTNFLPGLLSFGAVGVALGTWVLTALPERALSIVLSAIVFIYVGLRLASPHFMVPPSLGRRLAPAVGLAAGTLQGATGISSPVGVTFIHALRLNRSAHIFAVSAMFLLFNAVQVPALAVAGVLTWPLFWQGVLALAPALAMMPVGSLVSRGMSQRAFDLLVLALLAIVALHLLWSGLRPTEA
jgi:uncharacterized membrane protein YfcA